MKALSGAAVAVLRPFVGICLLQRRPQDLPAALVLFVITALTNALGNALLAATYMDASRAALIGSAQALLMLIVMFALLVLRRVPGRWLQTGTAISGTGTLFSLAGVPLLLVMARSGAPGFGPMAAYLAVMGLVAWNVAVLGHILRHALSIPMFAGVVVAIAYLWGVNAVLAAAIPAQSLA